MEITILLDHNLEGYDIYLAAGLKEIGWDHLILPDFKRLRDYGLPDDLPDQDIWRFVQVNRLLLVTSNRNDEDETSLQATMRRENGPTSLPIITIPDEEALKRSDYRQRAAQRLVDIIFDLNDYLGTGRLFVP